jgi:hypothetical protein
MAQQIFITLERRIKKMKETFHIFGGGDRSVGIWPTEATITVEDNYTDYDKDMVEEWKEFLYDFYDNGNITILTDDEYKEYLKQEEEIYIK